MFRPSPISGPELLTSRRAMLGTLGAAATSIALPHSVAANLKQLNKPVQIGMIADLHHDVMHDGPQRMETFLNQMTTVKPDALIQLGDFAYPSSANQPLIDTFNQAHPQTLHVIGNHDTDDGYTFQQVVDSWEMKHRYYSHEVSGLQLIVLDGNERPPNHQGGYPSHIGPEQIEWLRGELKRLDGPIIVLCHQPLAGPWAVDNAETIQSILGAADDKVILTVNGHSHIDHVVRVGNVVNLHINSASYQWVGGSYKHKSYPAAIHTTYPYIEYTCPYRDALFTTLSFDPESGKIHIEGCESEWVGPSPAQLGHDGHPDLVDGEQICPRIRTRSLLPPGHQTG